MHFRFLNKDITPINRLIVKIYTGSGSIRYVNNVENWGSYPFFSGTEHDFYLTRYWDEHLYYTRYKSAY